MHLFLAVKFVLRSQVQGACPHLAARSGLQQWRLHRRPAGAHQQAAAAPPLDLLGPPEHLHTCRPPQRNRDSAEYSPSFLHILTPLGHALLPKQCGNNTTMLYVTLLCDRCSKLVANCTSDSNAHCLAQSCVCLFFFPLFLYCIIQFKGLQLWKGMRTP